MTGASVRLAGLDSTIRDLRAVGVQTRDITSLLRKALRPTYTQARALVPYGTGTLRRSIKLRASNNWAYISATAPYAGPIHYGWPRKNISPNMFLRTPAKDNETQITQTITDGITQMLQAHHLPSVPGRTV